RDAGLDPRKSPATPATDDAEFADPYGVPLLPQLLAAAERNYRRSRRGLVRKLEGEVNRLHELLLAQQQGEADRLHEQKLSALAELAAGAGHEINTPLAVISGQAQLLQQRIDDPDVIKSLQTIVTQTRRVHEILTDMMGFARPPKPAPQVFDLALVARDAVAAIRESAGDRTVEIDVPEAFVAYADPRQTRGILNNLLRNSLEAVGADGWIRVTGGDAPDGRLRLAVEDSAGGPDAEFLDHLFDPFFSGRPAGRGRGLGLPTAWRLARQQGGDVRFEPALNGPAQFVILLPRAEAFTPGRMTA
ncbi:MAG: HAMP domain-containing histidine kinase, partial [Gemmataceae bacterium]|nr:HAMP domain-containing histidine kinase [Gemmataceae bacterium]